MNPVFILLGLAAVFAFKKGGASHSATPTISPNDAEKYCINYFENVRGEDGQVFVSMTDQEILDCYRYIHDYVAVPGAMISSNDPLALRISTISSKYNISL